MTRLTMIERLEPTQLASLPHSSAPKNAMNWIIRMTMINVDWSMPTPPRISGAAAKVDETAITVWMPSL